MKGNHCKFGFCKVSVGEVGKLLSINNDKPGIDNRWKAAEDGS